MNGNPDVRAKAIRLPRFRKMPSGPGKLLPDAHEVLTLEREVEITRDAVREAVVGRLVAFEASGGARIIERHGQPEQDGEDTGGGQHSGTGGHLAPSRGYGHADHAAPPVKKLRSSRMIPCRFVARDEA